MSASNRSTASRPGQGPGPIAVHRPPDQPSIPFARMPHGIASDRRVKRKDRTVALALLYWALDGPTCTVSDGRLADYLGISVATLKRSLLALKTIGYIRCERCKPTAANMTGRIIHLVWVEQPDIIPQPPGRKGKAPQVDKSEGSLRSEPSPDEGRSEVSEGVAQYRATGSLRSERGGRSEVSDKEAFQEPKEPPKNGEGRSVDETIQARGPGPELSEDRPGPETVSRTLAAALSPRTDREIVRPLTRMALDLLPADLEPEPEPEPLEWTMDVATQRAAISPLTPDETDRLSAMPDEVQREIWALLDLCDPIITAETRRRLRPKREAGPDPAKLPIEDLIRLLPGGDPALPPAFADRLIRTYGERKNRGFRGQYTDLARAVRNGHFGADEMVRVYTASRQPGVENPAAYFYTSCKSAGYEEPSNALRDRQASPRAVGCAIHA